MSTTLTLRGRLGTGLDTDSWFSLLLCTEIPTFYSSSTHSGSAKDGARKKEGKPKKDMSAKILLNTAKPACLVDTGDQELPVKYITPYDLLITEEQVLRDFEKGELGLHADSRGDGPYADPYPSVCSARLTYAKRGHRGTPARQKYWRETAYALGGRWVEATVKVCRYNFSAKGEQIMGAKLELEFLRPLD